MHSFHRVVLRTLASNAFFWFLIVFFVFQALWLALSFSYPMLWDEYYHFGLVEYYSHHINPIISSQPQALDLYGNVERSPKYFYHYLMSFPLRFFMLFTSDQTTQVILLRIVNIGLFVGGLVVYRHLLLRIITSKAVVNLVTLVLVLLPLTSLLAAHINYDNLQFLLTGLVLYYAVRFVQSKYSEVQWFLLVVGISSVAAIVKQTFLPIAAVVVLFLIYNMWRAYGRDLVRKAWRSFNKLSAAARIGLVLLIVVGGGLSIERFGGNLVQYQALEPKCDVVLSVERCMNFSPFSQEYTLAQPDNLGGKQLTLTEPFDYTVDFWFKELYQQYFITGTQIEYALFVVSEPLKIPYFTLLGAIVVALIALVLKSGVLLRRHEIRMLALAGLVLAVALWLVNFEKYLRTGAELAIQGRYLLPIVPIIIALGIDAVRQRVPRLVIRNSLLYILIIGLFWGGGLLTHILGSNNDWYWDNTFVVTVNESVRNAIRPLLW